MALIHKYTLQGGNNLIQLPATAQVLSVKFQRSRPCMWVKLDPKEKTVEREFLMVGTGEFITNYGKLDFIDTILTANHMYVFHIFEKLEA